MVGDLEGKTPLITKSRLTHVAVVGDKI